MKQFTEVQRKIKKIEPLLKERFKVKRIGIFGSYRREEQKRRSDIDILVEFHEPIGLFDFIELENFLSQKLRAKVDLVIKDTIKSRIKEKIIKETIYI